MSSTRLPVNSKRLLCRTLALNRSLRWAYYASCSERQEPYSHPPEVFDREPLGPWPEVNLFSAPCSRCLHGRCTPCFYSRVPRPAVPFDVAKRSLVRQLDTALERMLRGKIVTRDGGAWEHAKAGYAGGRRLVGLGLAGSFFSDAESDREIRRELLGMIRERSARCGTAVSLLLESHPLDILAAWDTGELRSLSDMFVELQVIHALGLESVDDFVRNVAYAKGLTREEFERAVMCVRECKARAAGFVFVGAICLDNCELVADSRSTLRYLASLDVTPILMFGHLQPYTLPHLLYGLGAYNLPDPWCVVACVSHLREVQSGINSEVPWFLSFEGGPPAPAIEVFSNPKRAACSTCSRAIRLALLNLRRTLDWARWEEAIEKLKGCGCYRKYLRVGSGGARALLSELMDQLLGIAEKNLAGYLACLSPDYSSSSP